MVKAGEKIQDKEVLERLAKAREKALEVRRRNAKEKKDAKLLSEMEVRKRAVDVNEKLNKFTTHESPVSKEQIVEKKMESETESTDEPDVVILKKNKKEKKKKIIYVEESSSEDEEPEKVIVKRKRKPQTEEKVPESRPMKSKQDMLIDQMYEKCYGYRR